MICPPVRYSYNTVNLDRLAPSSTSAENFLGTDDLGLPYGFRLSLCFGLILMLCTTVLAISADALQGYFGGAVELFRNEQFLKKKKFDDFRYLRKGNRRELMDLIDVKRNKNMVKSTGLCQNFTVADVK